MGDRCILFFNDPATTEIYPLSLHDALPIFDCELDGCDAIWPQPPSESWARFRYATARRAVRLPRLPPAASAWSTAPVSSASDRKSTRLNSSHANISYAVFCLNKNNSGLHPE